MRRGKEKREGKGADLKVGHYKGEINARLVTVKTRLGEILWSDEEKVPEDVDGSVDQGGSEDGTGFAPDPAIAEAGDGCEENVTPVREVQVGDVREAEDDGSSDPADGFAFGRLPKKILQQAAEEEFFRPCGEDQNGHGKRKEGFPFGDSR